jgi:hypothetical protein
MLDAVAGSAEVVQEDDILDVKFLSEFGGIHDPREIGGTDAIVDDRTGNAKTGGAHALLLQTWFGEAGKLAHNQVKLGEFLAGEAMIEDRREFAVLFGKEREIAFRATNIACKNHLVPLYDCESWPSCDEATAG